MLIGEVSERAGVSAPAIRYYESAGLLGVADRVNGRRVFAESVLDDLTFICAARDAGFGIGEIRGMVVELGDVVAPGDRWRAIADAKIDEVDRDIAELLRRRELLECYKRCDCKTMADYRCGY